MEIPLPIKKRKVGDITTGSLNNSLRIRIPGSNELYKSILQGATLQFNENVARNAVDCFLGLNIENGFDLKLDEGTLDYQVSQVNSVLSWNGRLVLPGSVNLIEVYALIRNDTGDTVQMRLGACWDFEKRS